MNFAISNIAWSPALRLDVYAAMQARGITGLEVAPGLLFAGEPDPFEPSEAALVRARSELDRANLQVVSMQSLLFGVPDAALFGSAGQRERIEHGLVRAILLAGRLGASNVVFGSPKQRVIPDGMSEATALGIARETFRRLGDLAAESGVSFALEPNPAVYETNFMTNFADTLKVVAHVNHSAVTLNFDVGALLINGEFDQLGPFFARAREHVSHVHLSEPALAPAPRTAELAATVLKVLGAHAYERWTSIEMRSVAGDELGAVEAALDRLLQAAATAAEVSA